MLSKNEHRAAKEDSLDLIVSKIGEVVKLNQKQE